MNQVFNYKPIFQSECRKRNVILKYFKTSSGYGRYYILSQKIIAIANMSPNSKNSDRQFTIVVVRIQETRHGTPVRKEARPLPECKVDGGYVEKHGDKKKKQNRLGIE